MIDLANRTVLVVEDSDEDWDTVQVVAQEFGIAPALQRSVDGEQCLRWLRLLGAADVADAASAEAPALLLLDLNLPGIDGHEVLALIKADAAMKSIPVVVFTTSSNPRDVDRCYAAGANAYHVKPVQYPAHLDALRQVLDYWLAQALLPQRADARP